MGAKLWGRRATPVPFRQAVAVIEGLESCILISRPASIRPQLPPPTLYELLPPVVRWTKCKLIYTEALPSGCTPGEAALKAPARTGITLSAQCEPSPTGYPGDHCDLVWFVGLRKVRKSTTHILGKMGLKWQFRSTLFREKYFFYKKNSFPPQRMFFFLHQEVSGL